jgi:hypothetical protein
MSRMRSSARLALFFLAVALSGGLPSATAHHGWGGYVAEQPLQVTGTVERITFENPHGLLLLATPDKTWEVVLAPPSRMINRGLTIDQIKVGDSVEVYGYPHRTRENELRAEWIKVNDRTTQLR